MLKKIVRLILGAIRYKRLPSVSQQEHVFLSELRKSFHDFSVYDTQNVLPSEAEWMRNMNHLRSCVLSRNPRRFLRWDVVARTMFIFYARYISVELNYIKSLSDWNTRWHPAIIESRVGHPIPFLFFPSTSANLIHHAYHVAQLEAHTRLRTEYIDYVFEFGGGYGSMCRLFYNLGFNGSYILFDLPPFSALQKYYLKTIGLPVLSFEEYMKTQKGIVCVSDMSELNELLATKKDSNKSLFIATWSISETPIELRNSFLPRVSDFNSFLIAYQEKFGEVDNVSFFENWKDSISDIDWCDWSIEHIPHNYYLMGEKRGT